MTEATAVFPDAVRAIERLRSEGRRFSFATGSDGFLKLDQVAQTFRYDAADAIRRKLARLDALRRLGIDDQQTTIGDPIGKPHPGFYERVLTDFASFYGAAADLTKAVAVGDSLASDVLPFLSKGVAFGAWLQRGRHPGPEFLADHTNVAVIGDLDELWEIPWSP